jgi:hypothetical protein
MPGPQLAVVSIGRVGRHHGWRSAAGQHLNYLLQRDLRLVLEWPCAPSSRSCARCRIRWISPCRRAAGSSSASSPGSTGALDWPGTSRGPSPEPPRSSTSPPRCCWPAGWLARYEIRWRWEWLRGRRVRDPTSQAMGDPLSGTVVAEAEKSSIDKILREHPGDRYVKRDGPPHDGVIRGSTVMIPARGRMISRVKCWVSQRPKTEPSRCRSPRPVLFPLSYSSLM